MMMMQWLFSFLFLSSLSYMPTIQSGCNHQAEISALLHFKDEFVINCTNYYGEDFGYPKTSSWNNGVAQLDGVECDPVTGHVVSLDLSSSCLQGSINSNSCIFNHLVHLEHLNLAYNNFQDSSIPSKLGNLSRLRYLNLSSSYFDGRVPLDISKLSMLTSLDLSNNTLDLLLNLKSLIGNLTNLEEFDLGFVRIDSEVPKWLFTNMSSLRSLKLDSCGLIGEFPQSIFYLPKLQHLSIRGNWDLEGHLPTKFNSSTTPLLESLLIGGTSFRGTIPVSIGNLTHLTRLDLSYFINTSPSSNFTTLSSWFGKLTNLRDLDIHRANLIGEIPHDSSLANLTRLGLSGNRLTGRIPSCLAKLTQLEYLILGDNQLTGQIPHGFVNLTKLYWLDLSNNHLSGTLDLNMFIEFRNLDVLLLSSNKLTLSLQQQRNVSTSSMLPNFSVLGLSSCQIYKFPKFLQHQQYLQYLDLSYNNIEGPIPRWMRSINTLMYIDLSHNFITALDDPHLFLRWPMLFNLDISFNKLRGLVPVPSLSVVTYQASNNELTGEIPRSFCNLPSLQVLDFSTNRLTGELDPYCFRKSDLGVLNLQNNSFNGKIPEFCTNDTYFSMTMIDLNSNQFQGKIPRSLANCAGLEFFDAGSNFLNDTFPSWLGSLRYLKVLLLKDNALHGSIGTMQNLRSGYWFPELIIIDLSQNSISGNLTSWHFEQWMAMEMSDLRNSSYMGELMLTLLVPGTIFLSPNPDTFYYSLTMYNKGAETKYLKIFNALITIDLSNNEFEGEIPSTIGNLRGLHLLNLSNNHLYGDIPSSLGNLKNLESLDLSSNRLSGKIPQQLTGLDFLTYVNLSDNNLTGLIPQGRHFDTFPNISYLGNPGLCGEPLSRKCGPHGQEAPQPPENMQKKEDDFWDDLNAKILWMVVSIGFGGGIVVGVAVENTVDWRMLILYIRSGNWRRI